MFINRWIDKQVVGYPYNKILLNNEKERFVNACNDMDESEFIKLSKIILTKKVWFHS